MTIVRELVTILRYQLDKSGLVDYAAAATTAAKEAQKVIEETIRPVIKPIVDAIRPISVPVTPEFSGPFRPNDFGPMKPFVLPAVPEFVGPFRPGSLGPIKPVIVPVRPNLTPFNAAMAGVGNGFRTVWRAGRDAFQGFNLGIRDGIREHRALNAAQEAAVKKVEKIGKGYSAMTGYIRMALGALSVQKVLGYVDSWGQMASRMKQATASAQEYAVVDKDLARISRLTYKSYSDNAELFVRTRRTMADLGKTTQDTVDVTEALSLGMVLSSTKAQDTESVIGSLSKAIMQNKLGMEEYSTLMRAAPRLQTALADGLGVTTGKLLEMVKAGKITTDKMLPALQSQLARMRIEAGDMPVTIADAFTVLNDAAQRFFGKTLTAGRWAVRGITKSIEYLADNIETVAKLIFAIGGALVFPRMLSAIKASGAAMRALGLSALLFGKNGRKGLLPFLRMVAVFETIRLIGGDIIGWLDGAESVTGAIVGRVEDWRTEIDAVKQALVAVKNLLGGADEETGKFLTKWGTIGILLLGLTSILAKPIGLITKFGRVLVTRLLLPVAGVIAAIVGIPAWVVIAVAAALVALVVYWDEIKKSAAELWKAFTEGAEQSWADIKRDFQKLLNWFDEKTEWLKNLLAGMAPDWLKLVTGNVTGQGVDLMSGINLPASAMQRGTGSPVSTADNRKTEVNIYGVQANPAAVGKAAEQGVNRAYGPAVPVAPNWGSPNVEALP